MDDGGGGGGPPRGQQGALLERVYIVLPVALLAGKVDYGKGDTLWWLRSVYFTENVAALVVGLYVLSAIRRAADNAEILVPCGKSVVQQVVGMSPHEGNLYQRTTYCAYETLEVKKFLKTTCVACAFTVAIHFLLDVKFAILVQIFMIPYNLVDSRLIRKHILGLPGGGARIWDERYEAEVPPGNVLVEGSDFDSCDTKSTTPRVMPEHARTKMAPALESFLLDSWDVGRVPCASEWTSVLDVSNVNSFTSHGEWTPLMVAAGLGVSVDVLDIIIDFGADMWARDDDGWTCVHWASYHGKPHILEALQARDASVVMTAKDAQGKSALSIAEDAGQTACVAILLRDKVY